MTTEFVLFWGQQTIKTAILVTSPILFAGMFVGLTVGIFQSVTQIQEMTLTFIPKIVAIMLIIIILGRWMAGQMVNYTHRIFVSVPDFIAR